MTHRSYDGPPIDGTVQWISERPAALGDDETGETVGATPDEDRGETTVEAVPDVGSAEQPETDGQTSLDEWRWSA